MVEVTRGVKAGLIAGIVSGILSAIAEYVLTSIYTGVIRQAIQSALPPNSPLTVDELMSLSVDAIIIGAIVFGVVGGAILGIIFAAVQDKYLKSQSLAVKGVVFGIVLWLLSSLLNLGNFDYGVQYVTASFGSTLITNLIFGYLMGYFYGRFGPNVVSSPMYAQRP